MVLLHLQKKNRYSNNMFDFFFSLPPYFYCGYSGGGGGFDLHKRLSRTQIK